MTEVEAQMMLMQGAAIDQGAAASTEAAMGGTLDGQGNIVPTAAANPDAAAMEWLIIPQTIAWALKMVFPEVAANYTEAAEMDMARKIVPVAEKHGWDGPGSSPEIALVFGAIGFSMPAFLAYRARKEAAKVIEPQPEGGADDGSRE